MPLIKGASKKTHSRNVSELVDKFKRSGKIGTSHPDTMDDALRQANAIAYRIQRKERRRRRKR